MVTVDDEIVSTWSTVDYWEGVAESVVRVTAAGFAGSLIGLAKERLYQPVETLIPTSSKVLVYEQQQLQHQATSTINTNSRRSTVTLPRRPPQMHTTIKTTNMTNLPIMWSISCMLFTIILESSRLASPTNILFQIIGSQQQQLTTTVRTDPTMENDVTKQRVQPFQNLLLRTGATSFGDYMIGGTIAGLAGVIGQQRQRQQQLSTHTINNRIPTIRFGLATGFGLGVIAGTIQAVIDVSNLYLEKVRQDDLERKQEAEMKKEHEEE
jgi:hypothetical protein